MSETSNQKALIEQLLSDRDAEFRRAVKAEQQLKELSDVKRMQADYEARLAEKEKAIQERDRALESKESWSARCGVPCPRSGVFLMTPTSSSWTLISWK